MVTGEFQPLVQALARVHGSLTEIATVWRRVAPDRPGLPLALPLRLAESVHELIGSVAGDPSGLAGRLATLERELAAAAALTSGPGASGPGVSEAGTSGGGAPGAGTSGVGDAGLWEYARTALGQAQELALALARLPLAS
jgi:hypothetical protein